MSKLDPIERLAYWSSRLAAAEQALVRHGSGEVPGAYGRALTWRDEVQKLVAYWERMVGEVEGEFEVTASSPAAPAMRGRMSFERALLLVQGWTKSHPEADFFVGRVEAYPVSEAA